MTNETRKRIEAYQKMLPDMKERVMAVAILLVMSVSMMISASFAWLTISRNPEVASVSTTVAANGNLEIALATSNDKPNESKVGDSSATEGQSIVASNITWGNLVNLSDPSYGLNNLVLRPARLNKEALLSNPLYGAEYTADGRVEKLTNNFRYTSWLVDDNGNGYFGISTQLGVRAISSTKLASLGENDQSVIRYLELQSNADTQNSAAAATFDSIMNNSDWMDLLAKIMGFHMCSVLEPNKPAYADKTITSNELEGLKEMFDRFVLAFEQEAEAMATLMNYQLFTLNGGDESNYIPYTKEMILSCLGESSGLKKDGTRSLSVVSGTGTATITEIETFLYDYYVLVKDGQKLQSKLDENKSTYAWQTDELDDIISDLVNIGKCLIKVGSESEKSVDQFLKDFSSSMSGGLGAMMGLTKYLNAECTATINNGVIYDFCKFSGAVMNVSKTNSNGKKGLPIDVAMYADSANQELGTTVYATIKTNAPSPAAFVDNWNNANKIHFEIDESMMTMQAKDTYALAVDLWVRTNAETGYLVLEGNILTESHEEPALGKNADAKDVPLYTLLRSQEVPSTNTETGEEEMVKVDTTYELYPEKYEQNPETGYLQVSSDNTKWYRQNTYAEFELEENEKPTQKWETVTTVIGYEGENRIWDRDDYTNITVDSTSQGSGSCYIFYADNPEDMEQSKGLLSAMRVSFIDGNGALLATAKMDVDHTYEENGRVIVPLVLDETAKTIATEEESVAYITELRKNEPMRITALVYLDGNSLTNQDVLSASEIQGQMNIQFGNSSPLAPSGNSDLELAERSVSASVSKTEFNYDEEDNLTTTVNVLVAGEQPNSVSAFFLRKISDTQGSREKMMTDFEFNASTGMWECDYTFTAPGTYILRTVELDGQEYVLKNTAEVEVKGFNIASLTCSKELDDDRSFAVMTAEKSSSVDLYLTFATDDPEKMPKTVQGRFLRDGAAVNVSFTYDTTSNIWKGTAKFITSGVYKLEHVVLDGKATGLSEDKYITADIRLGMKVRVYNDLENKSFKFLPAEMTDEQKLLEMHVEILDDSGDQVIGLSDAWLYYSRAGSAMHVMDTKLAWDPNRSLYVGYLKTFEAADESANIQGVNVGAGTWKFNRVEIANTHRITNAATAPVFELISPEPPKFIKYTNVNTEEYRFDGTAKVGATIENSGTANVMALMEKTVNGVTTKYYVAGRTANDEWFFDIPHDTTQDGWWTVKELYIWNYYDADNNWIGQTPLMPDGTEWVIDRNATTSAWVKATNAWQPIDREACMCVEKSFQMKVVHSIEPTFSAGQSRDFGKTNNEVTGTFMQTYEVSGITMEMLDFEGKPLEDIKEVTLEYSYGNNSQQYGEYSMAKSQATPDFKVVLKLNNEGKYVQEGTKSLQYAGSYTPTLTVNGKVYSGKNLPANTPVFSVSSKAPTVSITAISPTGTFNVDTTDNCEKDDTDCDNNITSDKNKHKDNGATASYTSTTANVYFKCARGNTIKGVHNYTRPSVTITLNNIGSASQAELSFGSDKHVYNNTTQTGSYVWTTNGTCQRNIGYYKSSTAGTDSKTSAGTITANTLTLKYGEDTFEFSIPTITINNPY